MIDTLRILYQTLSYLWTRMRRKGIHSHQSTLRTVLSRYRRHLA